MRSFTNLALGLLATVVGIGIVVSTSIPWSNFYLGGHFHPLGGWQGKGTLHSTTAGGDYVMWVELRLTPRARGAHGPTLIGSAVLCSPRGEYLPLNIWAQALRSHGGDLTGVPLHIGMNRWIPLARPDAVRSPQLDFYGTFGDDVLILEDHGSLGLAFSPDGRVRESLAKTPASAESIRVTMEKSALSRLPDGCIISASGSEPNVGG